MRNLLREIHRRSLWQVLGIYVATSWVVLQVAEQLAETLSLPAWVRPLALILLLIGLPIIMATAFMQAGPAPREDAAGTARPGGVEGAGARSAGAAARAAPGEAPEVLQTLAAGHRLFTWRNAILGGVLAFSLLFGFAGLYVLVATRSGGLGPKKAVAEEAAPGVAVLPFAVSGPDVEFWREGVASALATSLDGLLGLRTIDSRTVLAQWERAAGEGTAELATALEIAGRAGATWAVTGDLVATPTRMQIVANVYEVATGSQLGPVRVTGSADGDSTFVLLDRLAIAVLQQIPRPEGVDLPDADLARATTSSVEALRAYLEGEARFRRSDFEAAVAGFNRAIELDSTFAMAHYRLSLAYGWMGQGELTVGHALRAVELADRLPERDRLLARGNRAYLLGRAAEAVEVLEQAVRRYPDDVEAWTLLGDAYYHFGDQLLVDPRRESERAFGRAVELDPGASVAYIHLVATAFERADSARAAEHLGRYRDLAAGSEYDETYDVVWSLAFGASGRPDSVLAALETGSAGSSPISPSTLNFTLRHPRFWEVRREALERILPRAPDPGWAAIMLAIAESDRGSVRGTVGALATSGVDPQPRSVVLFTAHEQGLPIPADLLAGAVAADTFAYTGSFVGAALAAERGAWPEFERRLASLSSAQLESWGDAYADSVELGRRDAFVRALRAYATWRRGDGAAAVGPLLEAQRASTGWAWKIPLNLVERLWAAEILRELGRNAEAETYYRSLWPMPLATLRLAELHDAAGDLEQAALEYAQFLEMWKDADPELRPRLEAARSRLREIVAARG